VDVPDIHATMLDPTSTAIRPMSVSDVVARDIRSRLDAAERENDVRIVHACESGSRAWGFASPDSDYDVRFVYVRRPEWYLSFDVERRRDVIEYPIVDEIDIGGWDMRKALYLFTRTNGALPVAPPSIVPPIERLLARKRAAPEIGEGEPVPELDTFIHDELARHADGFSGQGRPETGAGGEVRDALNELFRLALREA